MPFQQVSDYQLAVRVTTREEIAIEALIDGVRIFYEPVGSEGGYPLFVVHGRPGLDHTMFRPWLDALGESFRLIYVDQRGQGRSERVDPAALTLARFARNANICHTK